MNKQVDDRIFSQPTKITKRCLKNDICDTMTTMSDSFRKQIMPAASARGGVAMLLLLMMAWLSACQTVSHPAPHLPIGPQAKRYLRLYPSPLEKPLPYPSEIEFYLLLNAPTSQYHELLIRSGYLQVLHGELILETNGQILCKHRMINVMPHEIKALRIYTRFPISTVQPDASETGHLFEDAREPFIMIRSFKAQFK